MSKIHSSEVILNAISSLLSNLEHTSTSLHSLEPSELFACQRKWEALIKSAQERIEELRHAHKREMQFLSEKATAIDRSNVMTDASVSTHLRWLFSTLGSLVNSTSSRLGFIRLNLDGSHVVVSSFASTSHTCQLHDISGELLDICRTCMDSMVTANVKTSTKKESNQFSSALLSPISLNGNCVGVIGLTDKVGSRAYSGIDEASCVVVSNLVGDYLYRYSVIPSLIRVKFGIPLVPFQEEYNSLCGSRQDIVGTSRTHVTVRIHTQPKLRPQWDARTNSFVRYPTDIASMLKDIQVQLDEAVSQQNMTQIRLEESLAREGALSAKLGRAMQSLDEVVKDAALLRLANQRLMSKSFLEANSRDATQSDQLSNTVSLSPRSPRWNGKAKYNRMKM